MTTCEAWVRFGAGTDFVISPKSYFDWEGYAIVRVMVEEVIRGSTRLNRGQVIVLKGTVPSLHPSFTYRMCFRPEMASGGGGGGGRSEYPEFTLLPQAGFRDVKRRPWTRATLLWSYVHEVTKSDFASSAVKCAVDMVRLKENSHDIDDAHLEEQEWYDKLRKASDYYRVPHLVALKRGWSTMTHSDVREIKSDDLVAIKEHLERAPHELCFFRHSSRYRGLPELSEQGLVRTIEDRPAGDQPPGTKRVHLAAVAFYALLKEKRLKSGHTLFVKMEALGEFQRARPEHTAIMQAALHWMAGELHLHFVDERGRVVPRSEWFKPCAGATMKYLQFPRDDLLKERILGHLRRTCRNFAAAGGKFTMRPLDQPLGRAPGGPLNEMQRRVLDHILANPITIIQGGPGSGKTFLGVDHLTAIFQWPMVVTHVGRQAVSLCERTGGHLENARTIHSAHFAQKANAVRVAYNGRYEVLIMDEVYNADDWTFEAALALCPNASRIVMVGDPDQIRPIPGEMGAGTPALDVAMAFPPHTFVLEENMRQRAEALAIHAVVRAIQDKDPGRIAWSRDLADPAAAAVRLEPPAVVSQQSVQAMVFEMVKRLRQGIVTHADEHEWQIVSFFNGTGKGFRGVGVKQLNDLVQLYLERTGHFRQQQPGAGKRKMVKITNRLTMYPGFKFMLLERAAPDKAILPKVKRKKDNGYEKRGWEMAQEIENLKGTPAPYDEVRNGQIEVVDRLEEVRVQGGRKTFWVVNCVPRDASLQRGTRLMISAQYHVRPSAIVPAWAVTSNKSMGGEYRNVGVYVPRGIGSSFFDRTNIYVACSRPTRFLCMMGHLDDFAAIVMRDPLPIRSGVKMRIQDAAVYATDDAEYPDHLGMDESTERSLAASYQACWPPEPVSWKGPFSAASLDADFVANVIAERAALYDLSERPVDGKSGKPVSLCPLTYADFSTETKRELTAMDDPKKVEEWEKAIMDAYRTQVYGLVRDNSRPRRRPAKTMADDAADPRLLGLEPPDARRKLDFEDGEGDSSSSGDEEDGEEEDAEEGEDEEEQEESGEMRDSDDGDS